MSGDAVLSKKRTRNVDQVYKIRDLYSLSSIIQSVSEPLKFFIQKV